MRIHEELLRPSKLYMRVATVVAAVGIAFSTPLVAASQQSATRQAEVDSRWQPWIGCWQAAAPQMDGITFSQPRTDDASLVCVVPSTGSDAAASSVNVLTVAKGKIVSRDTIEATGRQVARTRDACNGVEDAAWSADGHRLYVSSDFSCPGNLKRTSSGLFAISPAGQWVNVQEVNAGGNKGVRTLRYVPAAASAEVPAEIAEMLRAGGVAQTTARAAAGAPLTTADIVEASHKVDPMVVEAWIVDRGQSFDVDAKTLLALANAGVPGNVTDAMVAVTYPKAFDVSNSPNANGLATIGEAARTSGSSLDSQGARLSTETMPYSRYNYSPFGYLPYDYYGGMYAPYGYTPYGYAPFGYSPYGSYYSPYSPYSRYGGVYGGGWYAPPVIILKGSGSAQPQPQGRAVKGQGYTRPRPQSNGGESTGSSASPRTTVSPPSAPPAPQPAQPERSAHKRP